MNFNFIKFIFLLALISFTAPLVATAETVIVNNFEVEGDEIMVPCDVEATLKKEFKRQGCDLVQAPFRKAPDILVTGLYWTSAELPYATVRAADTVNGQFIFASHINLPEDENVCRKQIRAIVNKVLEPASYLRKKNFMDHNTDMEFIFISGGSFKMTDSKSTKKSRWVNLNSFFMANTEVTQGQWLKIMENNPSMFTGDPNLPVENVSLFDVDEYIRRLNNKTKRRYRLPTEAEWEYAARTRGRSYEWSGTNNIANLDRFAWTKINSGGKSRPVATVRANGLGLYDMSGNVWEWCSDHLDSAIVGDKNLDGTAALHVIRGGSWLCPPSMSRVALREGAEPESRFHDNGFRLVLELYMKEPPRKIEDVDAAFAETPIDIASEDYEEYEE